MLVPVLLIAVAAYGAHLVYTAGAMGSTGLRVGPAGARRTRRRPAAPLARWMAQAGLADVRPAEFGAVMAVFLAVGAAVSYALFGALLVAAVSGICAALIPPAVYRSRREWRNAEAREAWPRMIEEIRLLTGSVGRSIPQALLDVGRHGPVELRPAFQAAEREWLISTDFERTITILKDRLADPTADATCETLLVAYEVGGSDLERRLAALAEDRLQDLRGRKDALAQQSGVRFARRFVLVVPLGMALAGLSIGAGRDAYRTAGGQLAVLIGVSVLAACWLWAGRLLRLPENDRVFDA